MRHGPRVVFDCNIFFQALISPNGPSGRCIAFALDGTIELLCSTRIVQELRETATATKIRAKFSRITDTAVELLIENIERAATFLNNVPEIFEYPRDPDDAHYVNLALAAKASYVVSRDNDLLDLMDPTCPESVAFRQKFPDLEIIEPVAFLHHLDLHARPKPRQEH